MRPPLDFFRAPERRAAFFRPPERVDARPVDRLRVVVRLRDVVVRLRVAVRLRDVEAFRAAGFLRVVDRFAPALARFRPVARRVARLGAGSSSDGIPIPLDGSIG